MQGAGLPAVITAITFFALVPRITFAFDSRVDSFIHEGLPLFSSRVSPARLRSLKGLVRETRTILPNDFEPSLNDTHYKFEFPGLRVWLICPPKETRACLLSEITLVSSGYPVKFDLRVGSEISRLHNALGEPHQIEGNEWFYNGESSRVVFLVRNNRIASIRWDMYTG